MKEMEHINNLLREENEFLRTENIKMKNENKAEKTNCLTKMEDLNFKIKQLQQTLTETNRKSAEKTK